MFHDTGLMAPYRGDDQRFEMDGADRARAFLLDHRASEGDADTVWTAIAPHTAPEVPYGMAPVIATTTAGVETDVLGLNLTAVTEAQIDEVTAAHPRPDFERQILQTCTDGFKHCPDSTFGTVNADLLEHSVPGFRRTDFVEAIKNSLCSGGVLLLVKDGARVRVPSSGVAIRSGRCAGQTETGISSRVSGSGCRFSLSPSMSRSGSALSTDLGSHHAARPSSDITAGTSVIRTTKASMTTPTARANPMDLMIGSSIRTKPPNTDVMMSAAAVTTRALWPMPLTMAACGSAPWTKSSRMRETRKTS